MIRPFLLLLKAIPPNVKRLFTSLGFLRLKNRNLIVFQWLIPTFLALGIFLLLDRSDLFMFSYDEIMKGVNGLVGVLVGFYIAALAATATFPNDRLDKPLSGSPTTIDVKRAGKTHSEIITRRRYMTIIFGYCSFVSVGLFVFGLFQTTVKTVGIINETTKLANEIAFQMSWFVYIWFLCSLGCATLVGLHYLIDRMHRD